LGGAVMELLKEKRAAKNKNKNEEY